MPISLVLADDHPLLLNGLENLFRLEKDIQVLARCGDGVEALRAVRKQERTGQTITLSAADPLNLVGIVLPGPRVPALRSNTVSGCRLPVPTSTTKEPPGARCAAAFANTATCPSWVVTL